MSAGTDALRGEIPSASPAPTPPPGLVAAPRAVTAELYADAFRVLEVYRQVFARDFLGQPAMPGELDDVVRRLAEGYTVGQLSLAITHAAETKHNARGDRRTLDALTAPATVRALVHRSCAVRVYFDGRERDAAAPPSGGPSRAPTTSSSSPRNPPPAEASSGQPGALPGARGSGCDTGGESASREEPASGMRMRTVPPALAPTATPKPRPASTPTSASSVFTPPARTSTPPPSPSAAAQDAAMARAAAMGARLRDLERRANDALERDDHDGFLEIQRAIGRVRNETDD